MLAFGQRLRFAPEAVHTDAETRVRLREPLTVKPRSSNHRQISGTRSGALRSRVQMTVPPVWHNWQQVRTVRSMSSSVMLPNTPQTSTRSAGVRPR